MQDDYGILSGRIDSKLTRVNCAFRALFHYANSGKYDLYSGFRLGYTKWKLSAEYSELFKAQEFKYGTVAPQVILFGFRGYFTDHFGAGGELCIGPPYFLAASVNYRF